MEEAGIWQDPWKLTYYKNSDLPKRLLALMVQSGQVSPKATSWP